MRGGEVVRVDWLSVKSVSKTVLGLDDALVAKNSQKTRYFCVSVSSFQNFLLTTNLNTSVWNRDGNWNRDRSTCSLGMRQERREGLCNIRQSGQHQCHCYKWHNYGM